jgi:hypothetical protein
MTSRRAGQLSVAPHFFPKSCKVRRAAGSYASLWADQFAAFVRKRMEVA